MTPTSPSLEQTDARLAVEPTTEEHANHESLDQPLTPSTTAPATTQSTVALPAAMEAKVSIETARQVQAVVVMQSGPEHGVTSTRRMSDLLRRCAVEARAAAPTTVNSHHDASEDILHGDVRTEPHSTNG